MITTEYGLVVSDGEEKREFPPLSKRGKKDTGWFYDEERGRLLFFFQRRKVYGISKEILQESKVPLRVIEQAEKELRTRKFLPEEE
jgi:DNA primase